MDSTDDTRQELYDRFRQQAGDPQSTDYFDEDELIEIYDYANDLNDDFVKMEVLFAGARMCPASDALAIRRNYLYYYLGYDDAAERMLQMRREPTTLSRLLALRRKVDKGEDITADMNDIMARVGELDDEEVIQIVNEAPTTTHLEWLRRNLDRIAAKCTYKPTLYYEIASVAQDLNNMPLALEMADQLTMLEPFNIEFWEMYAELMYAAADYDGCLSTVDFALAIDSNSTKALTLRALATLRKDPDDRAALEALFKLYRERNINEPDVLQTIALVMMQQERYAEAADFLRECVAQLPGNPAPLDYLMLFDTDNIDTYVRMLASDAFSDDEEFWLRWAMRQMKNGNYRIASLLLLESYRRNRNVASYPLFLEALYRAGFYGETAKFFETLKTTNPDSVSVVETILGALALVKLGRPDQAVALAKEALIDLVATAGRAERPDEPMTSTSTHLNVMCRGAKQILEEIVDNPLAAAETFLSTES